MKKLLKNIKDSYAHVPYTFKHKKAMLVLEKQFTGKNSFRILIHDMDKVLMYIFLPFLGTKLNKKIHRITQKHHHFHDDNLSPAVIKEMILDWESAQYTKETKPLTARQYCLQCRPYLFPQMEKYLNNWNI